METRVRESWFGRAVVFLGNESFGITAHSQLLVDSREPKPSECAFPEPALVVIM